MNKNVIIAKQLVKIAKSLIANNEIDAQNQARLDEAEALGKKYILHHKEQGLWKIQACKSFNDVTKGDFGGYVESEENLSHDGDCWIYEGAQVFDEAKVFGNARVYGGVVCDSAKIYGDAKISGSSGTANVYGNAQVYGSAKIWDFVQVYGHAQVYGSADINGSATRRTKIYDDAQVYGNAVVWCESKIHGNARVDYQVNGQEITE